MNEANFLRNLGVQICHHVLDSGVILEAIARKILAVTRALEATMRHLGDDWNVCVEPDATEVKDLGHTHRTTMV